MACDRWRRLHTLLLLLLLLLTPRRWRTPRLGALSKKERKKKKELDSKVYLGGLPELSVLLLVTHRFPPAEGAIFFIPFLSESTAFSSYFFSPRRRRHHLLLRLCRFPSCSPEAASIKAVTGAAAD